MREDGDLGLGLARLREDDLLGELGDHGEVLLENDDGRFAARDDLLLLNDEHVGATTEVPRAVEGVEVVQRCQATKAGGCDAGRGHAAPRDGLGEDSCENRGEEDNF